MDEGKHAKDARGVPCETRDPYAVCWCMYGAIDRAARDLNVIRREAQNEAIDALPKTCDTQWNDKSTKAKVLEVMRSTAASMEAR